MALWRKKRTIMRRYDLTAEMYNERYAEEQRAKYKAAVGKVNLGGCVVLDVGCGTGLFFREVAAQASMIVGVDISRKLLLKAHNEAKTFRNVFVLQADADHLPLKAEFFNAVFAFTVLQNMPSPSGTLSELKRVTKTGGRLVVTGLKKAFSLSIFTATIESAGLQTVSLINDGNLKCYVAVLGT